MVPLFFSFFLTACGPRVLFYPGPMKYVGKGSHSYTQRHKRRIAADKAAFAATRESEKNGRQIAESAADLIGKTRLHISNARYRYDCSGFVEAVYASAGVPVVGSAKMLHDQGKAQNLYHKNKRPLPGDLAFFDNSHDRNKNGRRDDKLTHVAIVERIDNDGMITLIHLGNRGIMRIQMNLEHPQVYKSDGGKLWNSYLRARTNRKDKGPRLTGELWTGFARLWKQG